MNTLITFKDTWALWAVLFGSAAFGLWIERTPWGARLPGAAFTLIVAFLLSNFGVIPAATPVYRTVWLYLVPLAIPLLLFNANVHRIPRDAGFTLIAFAVGAVGTIVGTVVAFYIVPLGKSAWQLAAVFSAAYIGGPMNSTATAQAVGLRAPNLLAGLAAIDLMMMVYFLFLFALPVLWNLRWSFNEPISDRVGASINLPSMAFALALSAAICVVGFFIEARFGWKGTAILIIAAVAVALAAALPRKMATLQGANEMGMLLMLVFFATIGASANIGVVFKHRPILLLFAAVILAVHLAVILSAGKYLRINLSQIIIASSAGVGDSTSAAAMAAVKRWYQLVPAAILCGTLGYASATFIGVKLGKLLH
ncbi:MAG TPA: DUF819 family protein [Acidiferrobacterales bacterium]|nr:DUF819 family protein [Acidiferrobacterales bacterium]